MVSSHPRSSTVWTTLLLVVLFGFSADVDRQTVASRCHDEPDGTSLVDGTHMLAKLLVRDDLRLSTDAAPNRFCFRARLSFRGDSGELRMLYDVWVIREDDRVALLVLDADGFPYCFILDGLLAIFDNEEPGQLRMVSGGSPTFALRGDDNELEFRVRYNMDVGHEPDVDFDLKSLLGCGGKVESVRSDRDRHTMIIESTNATSRVVLAQDQDAANGRKFAILRWSFSGEHGSVTVDKVDFDTAAAKALLDITAAALQKAFPNHRVIDAGDPGRSPLPPPEYRRPDETTKAARLLREKLGVDRLVVGRASDSSERTAAERSN